MGRQILDAHHCEHCARLRAVATPEQTGPDGSGSLHDSV
jgi:hypothetical protein